MKVIQLTLLLTFTALFVDAQKDKVILSINGDDIYKSEFEYVFKKNNNDDNITEQDLDEYMELFVNYKLKVKEAEEIGMDTINSFVKELNGYRNQLAAPYLIDKSVNEELIHESYERMKTEIRASHILIKLEKNALPQDTLAAYQEALNVRSQIVGGQVLKKLQDYYHQTHRLKLMMETWDTLLFFKWFTHSKQLLIIQKLIVFLCQLELGLDIILLKLLIVVQQEVRLKWLIF